MDSLPEDDELKDHTSELPSDYQEFRRSYRWLLLYGPWALGFVGLAMVAVGLFVDRPGGVALAAIGFGAAMVIAGVLLPRMQGPLELGPSGVKGAVHGLPTALMVAAVAARETAEQAIPPGEPDKERKVNEAVGWVVNNWALWAPLFSTFSSQSHTSEDAARWASEGLKEMLASEREWTEEDWSQWFRTKRQEEKLRRNPPDDQDR